MSTLVEDALLDTFDLSFEQTVPRSLVHKRSLENVLLTEVRAVADDRFVCAGRIPTAHRFFNDAGRAPHNDILFYTELGRQASLGVSHTFLGVSKEDVFIFEQSQAWLTPVALSKGTPGIDSVVIEIKIRDIERRKNNAVSRVVAEHIMFVGSDEVFRGTGAWTVQTAALFQRLRRMSKNRPEAAADGRVHAVHAHRENVVITPPQPNDAAEEFVTSLIVDETHPYFFDHPCDHVPGMLLLEGSAQLAKAATVRVAPSPARRLQVSAYDMNFVQFVETNSPITLSARVSANDAAAGVHISISQQNVVCGTATLTVAFPA